MAKEWSVPKTATVKFNVAMTEAGNIAQSTDEAAANKVFSMPGIKTDANLSDTQKVYSAFVTGLAGGRYDESTGKKIVEYTVVDDESEGD